MEEILNSISITDINAVLGTIIQVIIIPLITLGSLYLKKFINTKMSKLEEEAKNEVLAKQLEIAKETLEACVTSTSETFVKDLKKIDNFTDEDKVLAFEQTRRAFLDTVSTGTILALETLYGDYDNWIRVQTEKILAESKKN